MSQSITKIERVVLLRPFFITVSYSISAVHSPSRSNHGRKRHHDGTEKNRKTFSYSGDESPELEPVDGLHERGETNIM